MNLGDAHDALIVSADESEALARWLLKVALLSHHPARDYDHPALNDAVPTLSTVRPEWLSWMTTATAPPPEFSVFITRRNTQGADPAPAVEERIVLLDPDVDGVSLDFMAVSTGIIGVSATIVWHPGWPISHAQVNAGRAVCLWPDPHEFDFGALPQVHPRELQIIAPGLKFATNAATFTKLAQTPLSVDADAMSLLASLISD
ncbi:hypothetical protein DEI86_12220 [Curtobacterium sp. MCBD17_028]|nr:hypothetical protein DEI86_12220 [Curtobacterium sp. MCBD17_028]